MFHMKAVKFATQIDPVVARDLRRFAEESDRSISKIVSEAVSEYLQRHRLRPKFHSALEEVLADHDELLNRLAK